jgi:hypothetical protein
LIKRFNLRKCSPKLAAYRVALEIPSNMLTDIPASVNLTVKELNQELSMALEGIGNLS